MRHSIQVSPLTEAERLRYQQEQACNIARQIYLGRRDPDLTPEELEDLVIAEVERLIASEDDDDL